MRIIALVVMPVLLFGSGCQGAGDSGGSVEHRFTDIESTLDSIESELAEDGR